MKKLYILIALFLSISLHNVIAQTADSSTVNQAAVHNVIYFEVATFLIMGSVSLNYEHSINENYWLRIGYGGGYLIDFANKRDTWGRGPMIMAMYLMGDNNKLEFGLGGTFLYGKIHHFNAVDWWLFPAASIGYRYQPSDGGVLFRVGLTYDYYMGAPVELSIGYAF